MKVLHITSTDDGGAGLCCLRIHQSLLNLGIESKVVTLRNTKHVLEEYEFGFYRDRISKIWSKVLRKVGLSITERNKLMKLMEENGAIYSSPVSPINLLDCKWVKWADVIHLHWVCNYLDIPSFMRGVSKPVVWTLHDENFFYGIAHYSGALLAEHPLEKHYAHIKREALGHVDKLGIVLLSDYFQNKFRNNKLLSGREVRVINNPVNAKAFVPILKSEARKMLHIAEDDIIFAFTAFDINDERKGLDVLSQAIAEIRNPRIRILAIGGNCESIERTNVISIGMRKGTTAMSAALSAADYYAMPSMQEAFAQSPMEAMACGLPVVVYPVSGTSELVTEQNGVICEDFTLAALTKGIEVLMSKKYNPEEIRQDMVNRFSPEKIAKEYIDLYKYMLLPCS